MAASTRFGATATALKGNFEQWQDALTSVRLDGVPASSVNTVRAEKSRARTAQWIEVTARAADSYFENPSIANAYVLTSVTRELEASLDDLEARLSAVAIDSVLDEKPVVFRTRVNDWAETVAKMTETVSDLHTRLDAALLERLNSAVDERPTKRR